MNRADTIRSMTDEQLAQFLLAQDKLGLPDIAYRCWFYCDKHYPGCFHKCSHDEGAEFIQQWLHEECGDYSHMKEGLRNSKSRMYMKDIIEVPEGAMRSDDTPADEIVTDTPADNSFSKQFFKLSAHADKKGE